MKKIMVHLQSVILTLCMLIAMCIFICASLNEVNAEDYNSVPVPIWYKYDEVNKTLHLSGIQQEGYIETTDTSHQWNATAVSATKIVVENQIKPNTTNNWFSDFEEVAAIDLTALDTSNVTNMGSMFRDCSNLRILNVSNFDTSNVTNMAGMFTGCRRLESLDLSNFNTSNVIGMSFMFFGCNSLTTLDISRFDTSKVNNMMAMFEGCRYLTTLDVSRFNTSNVTNMQGMFNGCTYLTTIDVSRFDTSKVTDMSFMYLNCNYLTTLDMSNFKTSKVTDMSFMFAGCDHLVTLDVSKFDTSNVKTIENMFSDCMKLRTIYAASNADWSDIESTHVFYGSSNLVGGAGTTHDYGDNDSKYARIDGLKGSPGYFTSVNGASTVFDLPTIKILKPKAGKKSSTISWKKISKKKLKKTKKIQIQYSLDKRFRKSVKTKYANAKETSLKIKGLKSKRTYYVRIRAYTKSGKTIHVSKWSNIKSFKTK